MRGKASEEMKGLAVTVFVATALLALAVCNPPSAEFEDDGKKLERARYIELEKRSYVLYICC